MKLFLRFTFLCLLTCINLIPLLAQSGGERITNYEVDIELQADRSVHVKEQIRVIARGLRIKRGITRSYPDRREIDGKTFPVKFRNLKVMRDGQVEPFTKKGMPGGEIFYIGQQEVRLPAGEYQYTIEYDVTNQARLYDSYDQLIWNAIGLDVEFPIDQAKATIHFPGAVRMQEANAYVGLYGAEDGRSRVTVNQLEDKIEFIVKGGLQSREGLTTDVKFNKGVLTEPSIFAAFGNILTLIFASILLLLYFVATWFKYGIDPPPSPETALLYETPASLSPASLNYLRNEKYQNRALISSMISLATKGYLDIKSESAQNFMFGSREVFYLTELKPSDDSLPPEEAVILNKLFGFSKTVVLDDQYQKNVAECGKAHRTAILGQHKAFVKEGSNLKFIFIPLIIIVLAAVISTVITNVFALELGGHFTSLFVFIPVALILVGLYRYLIIQPTVEKLNLQTDIEAFRKYIELNPEAREQLNNAPELNQSHFEAILPFAYALELENDWSSTFDEALSRAAKGMSNHGGIHPAYIYMMPNFYGNFNRNIRTASQPPAPSPSSSGGGGGGGFSGGGGGGGGVGGW